MHCFKNFIKKNNRNNHNVFFFLLFFINNFKINILIKNFKIRTFFVVVERFKNYSSVLISLI